MQQLKAVSTLLSDSCLVASAQTRITDPQGRVQDPWLIAAVYLIVYEAVFISLDSCKISKLRRVKTLPMLSLASFFLNVTVSCTVEKPLLCTFTSTGKVFKEQRWLNNNGYIILITQLQVHM